MKTSSFFSIMVAFSIAAAASSVSVYAETLSARGRVIGSLFNTSSRQHIEGSVTGSGVLQPSGDRGTANGRITSIPGQRKPQATVLGLYRVRVQANVRYDGGSQSVSESALIDVNRRSVIVRGIGRVNLDRPVDPRMKGRQRFSGDVFLTIRGL